MGKKTNTLLFIIGGTIFNIVLTVLCFVVFYLMYINFFFPHLPQNSASWVIPVNFAVSTTTSWIVYRRFIKFLAKKTNIAQYIIEGVLTRRDS